jgi:hypothetical protein
VPFARPFVFFGARRKPGTPRWRRHSRRHHEGHCGTGGRPEGVGRSALPKPQLEGYGSAFPLTDGQMRAFARQGRDIWVAIAVTTGVGIGVLSACLQYRANFQEGGCCSAGIWQTRPFWLPDRPSNR